MGGIDFHDEARAEAPFAAHGDPEEEAQYKQAGQGRRETRRELEHREKDDVGHQHRPATEVLGEPAEAERANRARGERQEHALRDRLHVGPELLRDGGEHEDHQAEIERVERPAEIARPDRVSLRRFERLQVGDQAHAAPLLREHLVPGAHPLRKPSGVESKAAVSVQPVREDLAAPPSP